MKALVLDGVQKLAVREVPDPTPAPDGVVLKVKANGVCRSDWHIWKGDIAVQYPLIMGHELVGVVEEVGRNVTRFKKGDRVIVPFSMGDGTCEQCRSGNSHLCDSSTMPGVTYDGGYGEYVAVPAADANLIPLPEELEFAQAAALGCRFMTAFHGIVDRARVQAGEWVVVYGCGGVGLSAINIATALGAQCIAVDVNSGNLELAKKMGAIHTVDAREADPVEAVLQITKGGAHVSVDALGSKVTCLNGINSLRKRGRHLQIGITKQGPEGDVPLPVTAMIMKEIEFITTLGMQAHRYGAMLPLVVQGRLSPQVMVNREISLSEVQGIFEDMTRNANTGTFVVTKFE